MLSKVRILDGGSSEFLPGEIIDVIKFTSINKTLEKKGKKQAIGERLLLGLTRIALCTDSWLSAASFQETIRVLVEASTTNRMDTLSGLKENVIIGKLIPAGDTFRGQHKAETSIQKDAKDTKDAEEKREKGTIKEIVEEEFKRELPII